MVTSMYITFVILIYFILYAAERIVWSFSKPRNICSSVTICFITCQIVSHKSLLSNEDSHLGEDYRTDILENQSTTRTDFDSNRLKYNVHIPISTLYLLSSLSHLLRDSYKRGLWLWFIYSYMTSPLYFSFHLLLIYVLPFVVMFCMKRTSGSLILNNFWTLP